MSEMKEYKCPNCGGALNFDSDLQKMKCPYCESVFEMDLFREEEELENPSEAQSSKQNDKEPENAGQQWSEEERKGLKLYSCKFCGAEIIGDETLSASTCPYCGNQIVIKKNFAGDLRPDYVIPFKLKKKEVLHKLQEYMKDKKLLPNVFKDQHHIEEIKAVYVPYWLFDMEADAKMHYEATKLTGMWESGDYRYEEFSHYDIIREGSMDFQSVPADGSRKMPDDLMESLEPYDMKDAVAFEPAYLAGYLADRYDVTQEESMDRIRERVSESVRSAIKDTVQGYDTVHCREEKVELQQKEVKYALFPVWLLNTSWNGTIYTFAMNGQTGRFIGNLPVDMKKFWMKVIQRTLLYSIFIGIGVFALLLG